MRSPLGARFLSVLAGLWLALAGSDIARADDDIEVRTIGFAERGGQLVVKNLGLSSSLFDRDAYHKLEKNPLATVIVVRLFVYLERRDAPVSYRFLTMRVVYDLWDEDYIVRIDGPAGKEDQRYARLDQAFRKITEFTDLPIAGLSEIAIGPHHYMAMVAELNPVSDETQGELRRWLSRPAGSSRLTRGSSFFGSFVSIFINTPPPAADRVVRMRSQPFYRVAR